MMWFWRALIIFLETLGELVLLFGRLSLYFLMWLGDVVINLCIKLQNIASIMFLETLTFLKNLRINEKFKKISLVGSRLRPAFNKYSKGWGDFARTIIDRVISFWAKLTTPRLRFFRLTWASRFFFQKLSTQIGQFFLALFAYLRKIGHTQMHLPEIKPLQITRRRLTQLTQKPAATSTIRPRLRFPKIPGFVWGFFIGGAIIFFGVFVPFEIRAFLNELPHPRLLSQRVIPVTTQIFDRNGILLYEIHGPEDRKPATLAQIPETVKQATLAIEDKSFYNHPGFSITAIARAARETFINNRVQGGSTLTQQLIKTALLTSEVTLERKIKELVLAFWAERIYTKDQILEMYFNQVPYGGTAWGIEAAAEVYFNKKVSDLTLAEAAFLAGLPAAPTYYSPYGQKPELAKTRQTEVLNRMVDEGFISQDQADASLQEKLNIIPPLTNIKAPHFVMWVRTLVAEKFGTWAVEQGGLRIYTTLDLELQEQVQQLVTENIQKLTSLQVSNGAAIVANPTTGEILAMVGSHDYFNTQKDGNVNVTISPRQPGSAIKPLNYAAALENGLTAASVVNDSPVVFQIPGSPAYKPVNYDDRFHGLMTLRTALANSYNVPAVKVLNQIGVKSMVEMGKRLGITTWENDKRFGLALTLGGGEVTLYELSQVYAVLANQGVLKPFDPFVKITDYSGRIYYEKTDNSKQVLSPAISFILSDILADNQARSQAFGPRSALFFPNHTVAVKTGTTNDKRDNWTLGYTPDYVVGVWVGNNDNSPMNPYLTSGVTGAAPIFNQIMNHLLKDQSDKQFVKPEDIVDMPCRGRIEYFVRGTEPKGGCGVFPTPSPSSQAIIAPSPSVTPSSIQLPNTQTQPKIKPKRTEDNFIVSSLQFKLIMCACLPPLKRQRHPAWF